ncbi:MAG TPA: hypothetical protein DE044_00265, partial [Alteromonas macleodii]|nr:hypothetical protein [Alteromonas macleodii]
HEKALRKNNSFILINQNFSVNNNFYSKMQLARRSEKSKVFYTVTRGLPMNFIDDGLILKSVVTQATLLLKPRIPA